MTVVDPLVRIKNLTVHFHSGGGFLGDSRQRVRALHKISLDVIRHQVLGVVGESGCGKTTLGRSLMRLTKPSAGEILFEGVDILSLKGKMPREFRRQMQMIFQNPVASLDPRMKIRELVAEPLRTHTDLQGQALTDRVSELLVMVGLQRFHMDRFPHALSGGQAQRVAIARSLALNPKFLVLDEPTSALDVSVQAQILNLLQRLQSQFDLTYLFISHDLALVRHISQYIAVMYLGEIVEQGSAQVIFDDARHPYTEALLSATPVPDPHSGRQRIILTGTVPSAANPPSGCPFHTRCPKVMHHCRQVWPQCIEVEDDHWVACHLLSEKNVS